MEDNTNNETLEAKANFATLNALSGVVLGTIDVLSVGIPFTSVVILLNAIVIYLEHREPIGMKDKMKNLTNKLWPYNCIAYATGVSIPFAINYAKDIVDLLSM